MVGEKQNEMVAFSFAAGNPKNSFFGGDVGSSQRQGPPSPDSPAIIVNKWARKAAAERCGTRLFWRDFKLKPERLSRQARDKHRKG